MKRPIGFALIILGCAAAALAQSAEPAMLPMEYVSPEAREHGIERWEAMEDADGTVLVTGLRADGSFETFTIRSSDKTTATLIDVTGFDGRSVSIRWDTVATRLGVTDNLTGRSEERAFNSKKQRWSSGRRKAEFGRRNSAIGPNRDLVELAAIAMADFEFSTVPFKLPPPGHGGGCSGFMHRGFGAWTVRSGCCQQATDDVNVKCWNQWCIGCCRLWDCDAACALGDYFCFCGRSGKSCAHCDT